MVGGRYRFDPIGIDLNHRMHLLFGVRFAMVESYVSGRLNTRRDQSVSPSQVPCRPDLRDLAI